MFSAVRKLPSLVRNGVSQTRNYYEHIGWPREQLSIAESFAHGLAISCGILAIPVYVITHICEYRGIEKAGKVGPIKKREE